MRVVVQRPPSSSDTGKLDPLGSWSRDLAEPLYEHVGSHTAGCSLLFGIVLCYRNPPKNNKKQKSTFLAPLAMRQRFKESDKSRCCSIVEKFKRPEVEGRKKIPQLGGKVALAPLSFGQCHFLFYSMSQAISLFPGKSLPSWESQFCSIAWCYLSMLTPRVTIVTVLVP